MLKKIRTIAAITSFVLITLLFLDFTGTFHVWFGWLAKIQIVPAVLAASIVVIIVLIVSTLLFGRIYCSVICPLGVLQDGILNISKRKKKPFHYSPAKSWLRYGILGLCIIAMIANIRIVSILDPYAGYGRIASNFFAPLYRLGNNFLAMLAEKTNNNTFYSTEIWIKSWITFGIAALTLFVVGILAWKNGRTYCNTICPVGTFLGFLSKFSLFRLTFDKEKCTKCNLCERKCKASCIEVKTMNIDHSRCIACFNCVEKCKLRAIKYTYVKLSNKRIAPESLQNTENKTNGFSRRNMLSLLGAMIIVNPLKAKQLQFNGVLATIENKKIPHRKMPIVPPGSVSAQNMKNKCIACQLCVSACPNNVLRPSNKLETLMQPEMSFERGYCRPGCVECSQVCPTNAIKRITVTEKSVISIGWAVWIKENCVVNTDKVQCNHCQQSCPAGAILLVDSSSNSKNSLKIPVIDIERCIGCGACEYHCPAHPFSAIYVEGHLRHHSI